MKLLTSIAIKNFKGIRSQLELNLNDSNFLIGPNNAGKSAILSAVRCFFDDDLFEAGFLNRTDYRAKKEGYNRCDIEIGFDLTKINIQKAKDRIIKAHGQSIKIKKSFFVRDKSDDYSIRYYINDVEKEITDIDSDIVKLLNSVHISYIHPQQAEPLLVAAQEKLKERIITNFGRHSSVSHTFNQLRQSWTDVRRITNESISRTLTLELQKIWPGCETMVDLPQNIEDIIKVSDITFRPDNNSQPIELTSQGTGAQSTILFQTHFILDSDRTLHQGMYHPLWLVEEPESFLHTDLSIKLGMLLNSDDWLNNIQFLVTSHDSTFISTTSANYEKINIAVINNNKIVEMVEQSHISDDCLSTIGAILGDPNFSILFKSFSGESNFFIEDTRALTLELFKNIGFKNIQSLSGSGQIKKHIDVLLIYGRQLPTKNFFIVDRDKGFKEMSHLLSGKVKKEVGTNGIESFEVARNVEIIALPIGLAIEDLFDEFDDFLTSVVEQLMDPDQNYKYAISAGTIPPHYSRTHAELRNKLNDNGLDGAKELIKKTQDVKDQFWKEIEQSELKMSEKYIKDLKTIL